MEEMIATEEDAETKEMLADDDIVVAIIDTGVNTEDELLSGRLVEGLVEGFGDVNGHGTLMAEIVASETGENVKILPLVAFGEDGFGCVSNVYFAIEEAIEKGAKVINISASGVGTSAMLKRAVTDATNKGISVVVAAGNDHANTVDYMPANIGEAITVSATDVDKNIAEYSNFGKEVDFAAYGTVVKDQGTESTEDDEVFFGTSIAAAYVSAYTATLYSYDADIDVMESLLKSAEDLGEAGYDECYGNGFLTKDAIVTVLKKKALTSATIYEDAAALLRDYEADDAKERLLVSTMDGITDFYGAVEAKMYRSLYIVAYETKEEATEAMRAFNEAGYEVESDDVLSEVVFDTSRIESDEVLTEAKEAVSVALVGRSDDTAFADAIVDNFEENYVRVEPIGVVDPEGNTSVGRMILGMEVAKNNGAQVVVLSAREEESPLLAKKAEELSNQGRAVVYGDDMQGIYDAILKVLEEQMDVKKLKTARMVNGTKDGHVVYYCANEAYGGDYNSDAPKIFYVGCMSADFPSREAALADFNNVWASGNGSNVEVGSEWWEVIQNSYGNYQYHVGNNNTNGRAGTTFSHCNFKNMYMECFFDTVFQDCTFTNCHIQSNGCANLTFNNCKLYGNYTGLGNAASDGVPYAGTIGGLSCNIKLDNTKVYGNTANVITMAGGGSGAPHETTPTILLCNGSQVYGGGKDVTKFIIRNSGSCKYNVIIQDSNTLVQTGGTGVYLDSNSDIKLGNGAIINDCGSGIYADGSATVNLHGGSIQSCTSGVVGASKDTNIYHPSGSITNCTRGIENYGSYKMYAGGTAAISSCDVGILNGNANASAEIEGGKITSIKESAVENHGKCSMSGGEIDTNKFGIYSTNEVSFSGTIKNSSNHGIAVQNGKASITGGSISGAANGVWVSGDGKATISGGSFTGNNNGLHNDGETTITKGDFNKNKGYGVYSSKKLTVSGGNYNENKSRGMHISGEATIAGATVSGNKEHGITSDGTLIIKSGTYSNNKTASIWSYGGKVTISGGSYTGSDRGIYSNTELTMTDGDVSGNTTGIEVDGGKATVNADIESNTTGVINRGTFTQGEAKIESNTDTGVVNTGTYNKNSGTINKNKTGVSNSGTFTNTTGDISSNKGNGVVNTGNYTHSNGNISSNGATGIVNSGSCNLHNGKVTSNAAGINNSGTLIQSNGQINANKGAGVTNSKVYTKTGGVVKENAGWGIENTGTFNLTSADIQSNKAGGVKQTQGTFNMSTNAAVAGGNVIYLGRNQVIHVLGRLNNANCGKIRLDAGDRATGRTLVELSSYNSSLGESVAGKFGLEFNQNDNVHTQTTIDEKGKTVVRAGDKVESVIRAGYGTDQNAPTNQVILSGKYYANFESNLEDYPGMTMKSPYAFNGLNYGEKRLPDTPSHAYTTGHLNRPEVYLQLNDGSQVNVTKSLIFKGWALDKHENDPSKIYTADQVMTMYGDFKWYAVFDAKCDLYFNGNKQSGGENYRMDDVTMDTVIPGNVGPNGNVSHYFTKMDVYKAADETWYDDNKECYIDMTIPYSFQGWSLRDNATYRDTIINPKDSSKDTLAEVYGCDNNQKRISWLYGRIKSDTFMGFDEEGRAIIPVYAVWDKAPVIEAYDLYITKDQVAGLDNELWENVVAKDVEDGTLRNRVDVTIVDLDKEELANIEGDQGGVSITYKATDGAGNITYYTVMVYVTSGRAITSWTTNPDGSRRDTANYVRFIDRENYNKHSTADGGMEEHSLWYTNPEYVAEINAAFDHLENKTSIVSYELDLTTMQNIQAYNKAHFNEVLEPSFRQNFYEQFLRPNITSGGL